MTRPAQRNRYKVTGISHHPGFMTPCATRTHTHTPLRPGPGSLANTLLPNSVAPQSPTALALGQQGAHSARQAGVQKPHGHNPARLAQRRPGGAGTRGAPPGPGNTQGRGLTGCRTSSKLAIALARRRETVVSGRTQALVPGGFAKRPAGRNRRSAGRAGRAAAVNGRGGLC